MNQKGFIHLWIILALLIVIGSIAGYIILNKNKPTSAISQTSAGIDTSQWTNYTNTNEYYSFQYPTTLTLVKDTEGVKLLFRGQTIISLQTLQNSQAQFNFCITNPLAANCEYITSGPL